MTAHVKSVHSGERNFECQTCNRRFARKQNLRNHIRTHSGAKPYKCNVCPSSFSNQANLIRHKKTHSGVKAFACILCEKRFSDRSNLKRHISQIHRLPIPPKASFEFLSPLSLPSKSQQTLLCNAIAKMEERERTIVEPKIEVVPAPSKLVGNQQLFLFCPKDEF